MHKSPSTEEKMKIVAAVYRSQAQYKAMNLESLKVQNTEITEEATLSPGASERIIGDDWDSHRLSRFRSNHRRKQPNLS